MQIGHCEEFLKLAFGTLALPQSDYWLIDWLINWNNSYSTEDWNLLESLCFLIQVLKIVVTVGNSYF